MPGTSPPPTNQFAKVLQTLAQFDQYASSFVEAIADQFQKAMPGVLSLIEAVQRMPDVLQSALLDLANEGWYLDWRGMSLQEPAELAEAFLAGRHQEVEDRLVEHYRCRLPEIEEELVSLIPTRAHIFRQAFDAHRQGLYYVTVPTLLAQADGVCLEYLGEHFFIKRSKQEGERYAKLANLELLTKAMLAPFFRDTSIRASSQKRPEGFDKLNRHLVLHGESFDYGTEVRSLQAIAFLYYVAVSLGRVIDRHHLSPTD
jgi:hypothetical protein